MQNLIVHITLPKGIKTVSGAMLAKDVTFDVISQLSPYYASVDQVRLAGGPLVGKLSDIALACAIYHTSQQADLLCLHPPEVATSDEYRLFVGARNRWVEGVVARDLLLNMGQLFGQKGGHVLANFSVTRQGPSTGEGLAAMLKAMTDEIKEYETTLRSRGRVAPGGRPYFAMAAKGVNDWGEATPGRTWIGNGMGVNSKGAGGQNGLGGRGKSVGFMTGPFGEFVSGPIMSHAYGMHIGNGQPLPLTMAPHPGIL
jgi:hypothetical protein